MYSTSRKRKPFLKKTTNGDPIGVIMGRLYEVLEVNGGHMRVIGGHLYEHHKMCILPPGKRKPFSKKTTKTVCCCCNSFHRSTVKAAKQALVLQK